MPEDRVRVVIAGGGTAGWLTAAALACQMGNAIEVILVESAEIGTVGVGEATIPPMKTFHRLLKIDERQFMKSTHATFKLGIQFENWKTLGEQYFHSFGVTGKETLITEFVHFWLRGRELGIAEEFGDYCVEFKSAMENRFSAQAETKINHAYHLDAGLYANFLRKNAERDGVVREEGKITEVVQDHSSGNITALRMDSGKVITGDFFVDCTGFRGLLIEQTLRTGFDDWSHWLPCDRAVAVQTRSMGPARPLTRSIAHHAGWRWQIPLQHRVGNGLVYCSSYLSDDEATDMLLREVEGETITEPRVIYFRTGKRRKNWHKNCVAVGLASGFLEPLESTSIHLIMTAITRLLQMLPLKDFPSSIVDEYNIQAASEIERIRDFIILHYKATERTDSPFWRYCQNMEVPDDLSHRIKLFRDMGKSYQTEGELFRLDSWTQVMLGQGIYPQRYHPIVATMKTAELESFLSGLSAQVKRIVNGLPDHDEFVRQYCGIQR